MSTVVVKLGSSLVADERGAVREDVLGRICDELGNATSPITHTHSCRVFIHNYVHDNNNPNVPSAGFATIAPVGTGISVSGGR